MTQDNEPAPDQVAQSNKSIRSTVRLISVIGLIVTLVAGIIVYRFVLPPSDYKGPATGTTTVHIHQGDSVAVVGNTLKNAGVISSVDRFVAVASQNPASTNIQPGKYRIGLRIPVAQALSSLLDLRNKIFGGVVVPEGLRVSEIVTILVAKTQVSRTEFESALSNPETLGLPQWANGKLEGFLFPASYEFATQSTAQSILRTMVAKAVTEYTRLGLPNICQPVSQCNGLTAYQVVTGASIMQAEVHPRDFHKVARVILNRLNEPMRLQMDSTVAYGRNKKQVMLSDADLKTDTPYNTYLHDGLTPSPISNPGSAAIEAMLKPADGDWLYFITVDLNTQETKFTNSYQEFLRFTDEFLSFCRSNPGSC